MMALDFIDEVLARINAEGKALWQSDVDIALRMAASQRHLAVEELAVFDEELAVWEWHSRRGKPSRWGTYYRPYIDSINEDSTANIRPDITRMGDRALRSWRNRLARLDHPALIARYADVIWDLSKVLAPAAERDHRMGRIAISAYWQSVRAHLSHTPSLDLERALVVAIELNDEQLIEDCCNELLAFSERAPFSEAGNWLSAARAFDGQRKVKAIHVGRVTSLLETRLKEAAEVPSWFAAESVGKYLIAHYRRTHNEIELHRVLRTLAETLIRDSRSAQAGVAIGWLQRGAELLEQHDMHADAEPLRLEMEARAPEVLSSMKTFETEIEIPAAELYEQLDMIIAADNAIVALVRLVFALIPKCSELSSRVKDLERDFPFYSLFHRSIIGRDGLPKAHIGSSVDDLEGRMMEQIVHDLQFNAGLFYVGFQKIRDQFALTSDQFLEFAKRSSMITSDMHAVVTESFTAYEAADYKATVRAFMPQLEPMLRGLLRMLSVPVSKGIRGINGVNELKNINDILGDARVIDTLDENLHFFLRAVYVDKRALSLRHEFSHQDLPPWGYNQMTAGLAFMTLVAFAAVGPHTMFLHDAASATAREDALSLSEGMTATTETGDDSEDSNKPAR